MNILVKAIAWVIGYAIATPIFYLYAIVNCLIDGWVLANLWQWFIVPQFGLDPLPIANAIGLSLFVGSMTHQTFPNVEEKKTTKMDKVWRYLQSIVLKPLIFLSLGWIIHRWNQPTVHVIRLGMMSIR